MGRVGRWRLAELPVDMQISCEHIELAAADQTAWHVHCPEPVEISELVWVIPPIDPGVGNSDSKSPCCLGGPSLGEG